MNKYAFNCLGTNGNEYRGVVAGVDRNDAETKLRTQGLPDIIQIEQTDDAAPESCTEIESPDMETQQEAEERRLQEEQARRGNRRQERQQPLEDEKLLPRPQGMPLWAKITAAIVGVLVIIAIFYAVVSNNRAQKKAIEALQAQIASLVANPQSQVQAQQQTLPSGMVPPPGITATNPPQPQQPLRVQGPPPGTAAMYQFAATGTTGTAPLVNVVVDNRWRFNASGGGTMTNAAGGQDTASGDTKLLALAGQGSDYLTFPAGTRWASLIIPQNATTNAPTVWVVMPDGADRYAPESKTDIWVQTKFADRSEGEWMRMSPVAQLPFTASPIRAMRFAVANPTTPVPFTIRFRGLQ
ncbi:MAG: hypothetical protein HYY10_02695 [Candidatus Liptonbacteria bacterium]|nr:hypothetical protein [Candidatus Liptonbacteria bacterium]